MILLNQHYVNQFEPHHRFGDSIRNILALPLPVLHAPLQPLEIEKHPLFDTSAVRRQLLQRHPNANQYGRLVKAVLRLFRQGTVRWRFRLR